MRRSERNKEGASQDLPSFSLPFPFPLHAIMRESTKGNGSADIRAAAVLKIGGGDGRGDHGKRRRPRIS